MKPSTKELIKDLTKMYIRDSAGPHLREDKMYSNVTDVHKPQRRKKSDTTWSPDLIKGKGEGLTILLHGRPGVGKTYTAGKLILASTSGLLLNNLNFRMYRRVHGATFTLVDMLRHRCQARDNRAESGQVVQDRRELGCHHAHRRGGHLHGGEAGPGH